MAQHFNSTVVVVASTSVLVVQICTVCTLYWLTESAGQSINLPYRSSVFTEMTEECAKSSYVNLYFKARWRFFMVL